MIFLFGDRSISSTHVVSRSRLVVLQIVTEEMLGDIPRRVEAVDTHELEHLPAEIRVHIFYEAMLLRVSHAIFAF